MLICINYGQSGGLGLSHLVKPAWEVCLRVGEVHGAACVGETLQELELRQVGGTPYFTDLVRFTAESELKLPVCSMRRSGSDPKAGRRVGVRAGQEMTLGRSDHHSMSSIGEASRVVPKRCPPQVPVVGVGRILASLDNQHAAFPLGSHRVSITTFLACNAEERRSGCVESDRIGDNRQNAAAIATTAAAYGFRRINCRATASIAASTAAPALKIIKMAAPATLRSHTSGATSNSSWASIEISTVSYKVLANWVPVADFAGSPTTSIGHPSRRWPEGPEFRW